MAAPILEPVHIYELDRASMRMVVARINPTRHFSEMTESGAALYTWQNGHWFGTGGQWIQDVTQVPEAYREAMRALPIRVATHGPDVVSVCEFCGESMNQSERDAHLVEHVNKILAQTGTSQPPTPPSATPPIRERTKAA